MKKKSMIMIIALIVIFSCSLQSLASSNVGVIVNGSPVKFTSKTGFPYIDKNKRTMVPLRATMESAGLAVGYDKENKVAIVIGEHNRVEVPIGTNEVYANNKKIINDTHAVVKNGVTYLPIRVVFENVGFTVDWDAKHRNVNAYSFDINYKSLAPYSTSNPTTLLKNILKGNVVYINGQYYATPEYVKLLSNTEIKYYSGDDLNKSIYINKELTDRDIANMLNDKDENEVKSAFDKNGWISGLKFDRLLIIDEDLKPFKVKTKESKIPGFSELYVFYDDNGLMNTKVIYPVDEMTDEFMQSNNNSGTFNGIRMRMEDGQLYFYIADLKEKGIL